MRERRERECVRARGLSEREQDYVREWGEYVGERGWRVRERESMRGG